MTSTESPQPTDPAGGGAESIPEPLPPAAPDAAEADEQDQVRSVRSAEEGERDGITDETGEYGPGVDQDTGANVGDTGTPSLTAATSDD